jgi:hypothetical protein
MKIMRVLLDTFIEGDKAVCIAVLNGIAPKEVMAYVLGRELTFDERMEFGTQSISNSVPRMQSIYQLGKIWQDTKQTCRKYLQRDESKAVIVRELKDFLGRMENVRR